MRRKFWQSFYRMLQHLCSEAGKDAGRILVDTKNRISSIQFSALSKHSPPIL